MPTSSDARGWAAGALALILGLIIFWVSLADNGDDDPAPVASATTTEQTATAPEGSDATTGTSPEITVTLPPGGLLAGLEADGRFGTFTGLLRDSGLESRLDGPGPYTVLAPTDDALAAVPAADLAALEADPGRLRQTLLGHIVAGGASPATLADGDTLPTLAGTSVTVAERDGTISVNGVDLDGSPPLATDDGGSIVALAGLITTTGPKVTTGQGLRSGIAGDYGPWRHRAWRDRVLARLSPDVAARARPLDDFKGGFGIRIGPG
ncbi:MAG: fasciclin domain-containing protein [Thermoleophilia bacterium]